MHLQSSSHKDPVILTLAGREQPGPDHWLSRWEAEDENMFRVDLGIWSRPHRNSWVTALSHAIGSTDRPVILVARGLACMAVAWWAAWERPSYGNPVAGALLVAPPNVDSAGTDLRLLNFGPAPKAPLPFASAVVASRNDPNMSFAGAQALAGFWGSHCFDGGTIGSASAVAELEAWEHGKDILGWLIDEAVPASSYGTNRHAASVVPLSSSNPRRYAGDISL